MSTIEFNQQLLGLRQPLYHFALGLTKDRDNALDLVQESLLRAITFRDRFRDDTNLKAWLYTILRNTFINGHRRGKCARVMLDALQRERGPASMASIPASAESSVKLSEVQRSLSRLDEAFREPFLMHHEGYKYHEIAARFSIPVGTVKSRIHQARKRLQFMLTDTPARS